MHKLRSSRKPVTKVSYAIVAVTLLANLAACGGSKPATHSSISIALTKPEAVAFTGAKCVYIDMKRGLGAAAATDNCTQDMLTVLGSTSPYLQQGTAGAYNEAQCISLKGLTGCPVSKAQFAKRRSSSASALSQCAGSWNSPSNSYMQQQVQESADSPSTLLRVVPKGCTLDVHRSTGWWQYDNISGSWQLDLQQTTGPPNSKLNSDGTIMLTSG